jgi:hypothetical protein
MAARHAAWLQRLPEDEGALWDWLIAPDPAALTDRVIAPAPCPTRPAAWSFTGTNPGRSRQTERNCAPTV